MRALGSPVHSPSATPRMTRGRSRPRASMSVLREAGPTSLKHSRAHPARAAAPNQIRIGTSWSRSPSPSLATPVGAFLRIYTITASLRRGRWELTLSGRRTPHPWTCQLGGVLAIEEHSATRAMRHIAGDGATRRMRQERPFVKKASNASARPGAQHSSQAIERRESKRCRHSGSWRRTSQSGQTVRRVPRRRLRQKIARAASSIGSRSSDLVLPGLEARAPCGAGS